MKTTNKLPELLKLDTLYNIWVLGGWKAIEVILKQQDMSISDWVEADRSTCTHAYSTPTYPLDFLRELISFLGNDVAADALDIQNLQHICRQYTISEDASKIEPAATIDDLHFKGRE